MLHLKVQILQIVKSKQHLDQVTESIIRERSYIMIILILMRCSF